MVVAVMLVMSLVPPGMVGKMALRRTNILSDVFTFNDPEQEKSGGLRDADKEFLAEAPKVPHATALAALPEALEQNWELGGMHQADSTTTDADRASSNIEIAHGGQAFEDYTPAGGYSVANFAYVLGQASQRRVVRIAFFGDSFIEGDIITGDVREQLQEAFGGQGVGFVPWGTPLAISRPSVKHAFGGWTNYNVIHKKTVPEEVREQFAATGTLSVPAANEAWSEFKGSGFRKRLGAWSRARLLFTDHNGGAAIEVAVNDSITRKFWPEASDNVQQISLAGVGMRSLKVTVKAPRGGFVGYGVVLEGARGVQVDNYAIRSNSGIAMFGTSPEVNAQLGRLMGYDMIVLQWGLNAMEAGATDFKAYGTQLRKVINYMKQCFPGSTVVLMGVGDRATQKEGVFVTMESVRAMLREQRAAAKACGVAFWSIFEAMGGTGSMVRYVENGWAAKDYTHLSHSGGRQIATKFVQSLVGANSGPTGGSFNGDDDDGWDTHESVELDMSRATADSVEHAPVRAAADSSRVRVSPVDSTSLPRERIDSVHEGIARQTEAHNDAQQNGDVKHSTDSVERHVEHETQDTITNE